MNLYKLHSSSKKLKHYDQKMNIPHVLWEEKYQPHFSDSTDVMVSGHDRTEVRKKLTQKDKEILAKHPKAAFQLAVQYYQDRFPEGEDAIATDPMLAYMYARKILKGKFEKGEKAIASNSGLAIQYALFITGERFPAAEENIREFNRRKARTQGYTEEYEKRFGVSLR